MSNKMPTYFISHGGGPWPWIPQMRASLGQLEQSLKDMVSNHGEKPKAVLMISGHWEEQGVTIMASPKPPMIYDYSGFPADTYEIVYGAPGAPELAQRSLDLLQAAGIPATLDHQRGFDHGTFTPLKIMYPEADVPIFQISMLKSYDPAAHFAMGRALAQLREEGVMIVGSGLSYHNLGKLGPSAKEPSAAFDAWLADSLALPPEERTARLVDWESAPSARICHPREDHLVPLFAALGAAEAEEASLIYHQEDFTGGVVASSYRFG